MATALARRRLSGLPIIDLTISNPTQANLNLPDPAFAPSAAAYAPSAAGGAPTREAVSRYYSEDFGSRVAPDDLLLTTSTSEAYSYCFKLIADPGAKVLLPQPSYPLLQFLVEAEGLTAVPYPLHEAAGQWIFDRDRLAAACDPSTRAIVVVNPNNPTGHFLSADDAEWLIDFAANRYWIICDEVFADYVWNPSPNAQRSFTALRAPNVLCLSGLSKICALPQMKLGWIAMPPSPEIRRNLEWIADTYLGVSSPIQSAAVGWLASRASFQRPIVDRCRENLALLAAALRGSPWSLLRVEAGWAAILRGPAHLDEESVVLNLLEVGFLAQPGFYYDLPIPCALVLSLLTPTTELSNGLDAIRTF